MNKFFLLLSIIVVVSAALFAGVRNLGRYSDADSCVISFDAAEVTTTVVRTQMDLQKGLGGLPGLPGGEGMLFVFEKEDRHGIWMKNMLFSIDIAWLDDGLRVVGISESVSPDTFPQVFSPNKLSKYVLEVSSGYFKEKNIKIDDIGVVDSEICAL